MKPKITKQNILVLTLILAFAFVGLAFAEQEIYPIKGKHPGGDVTPLEAYNMLKKDSEHTFLIDTRTRFEYQDIGHPLGAYNIPLEFYTTEVGKKGYKKVLNKNFGNDLKARFNPETDILLFLCRSAKRRVIAVNAAVEPVLNQTRFLMYWRDLRAIRLKIKKIHFTANDWSAGGVSRDYRGHIKWNPT